jgi:hypothetical protein
MSLQSLNFNPMNLDHLIDTLKDLPEPLIGQVQDYVDFLKTKHAPVADTAEERFWALIELIDWDAETEEGMFAPLIESLMTLEKQSIFDFITERAKKLQALDGPTYHASSKSGHSADGFLYARCAVVAMGRETYYSILKKPETFPEDLWAEKLLYCAEEAYEKEFGEEIDFSSGIIYESFHNDELWGEGATFAKLGITPNEIREKATAR